MEGLGSRPTQNPGFVPLPHSQIGLLSCTACMKQRLSMHALAAKRLSHLLDMGSSNTHEPPLVFTLNTLFPQHCHPKNSLEDPLQNHRMAKQNGHAGSGINKPLQLI